MSGQIIKFISPGVERIPLSDGDWIEVKKDLNTGEQKMLEGAGTGIPVRLSDGTVYTPIDWAKYEIERAGILLLDWSFKDASDKVVPLHRKDGTFDPSAIAALDPVDFEEVNQALVNHLLKRAVEKKSERSAARVRLQNPSQNDLPQTSTPSENKAEETPT